ncbi:MAG: hypothetical protein WC347_11910 [Smithellaceae bacterium]|jgi:hypothetical protein
MIGISTITYDLDGARIFSGDRNTELKNRKGERRISRTATLDGGVLIADLGFADGDRTLTAIELDATQEAVDFAKYLVENYSLINVTTDDGAYEVAPESYSVDNGKLSLTLLANRKISE